ncbi:MAG: hypothetical protein NWF08_08465 [Candidatus Bathyarchaeota archaeon]|nr:hypothetical protein [Candidatus Bathyarchaeota archaeon]
MKSGTSAGAIAGIAGGITSLIVGFVGFSMGLWGAAPSMTNWIIVQIALNLIWGTIFGAIYAKVYNVVPGKGVMKGLIYSLIIWLVFVGLYPISFFVLSLQMIPLAVMWGIVGFFVRLVYGPVLGALYKK